MDYPAYVYYPALAYYAAFFATAWWDGRTCAAPIILIATVCVLARDLSTVHPAAASAALLLSLPIGWGTRRGEIGPADVAIVFALGLRHGITDGSRAVAYAFFGLAVVASAPPRNGGAFPGPNPGGRAYPLIPALLAGDLLVTGGGL